MVAVKNGDDVRMFTRNGNDWTHRFQAAADGVASLGARTAVLDGEIVVRDDQGRSSFRLLQQGLDGAAGRPLEFVAFDLLRVDTLDARALPLDARRKALRTLLRSSRRKNAPRLSEELPGSPHVLLAAACRLGLEGIICKRRDAAYQSGRGRAWLKVKAATQGVRRHRLHEPRAAGRSRCLLMG